MATIEINGKILSSSAFENQSTITSVKFGSGCNSVGKNAFKKCISLSEINDDNVIKSIDTGAFGNTALESVTFNELETLKTSTFENCSKLSYVNIPNCSILYGKPFFNCSNLISIDAKKCIGIENNKAFEGCTNLSYVNIPTCSHIPDNMFRGFRNLTSIKLDNLKNIGYGVFHDCEKLNAINIKNCEKIINSAFFNCSSLSSIYIPNCSNIYPHAFGNCINLQSVFIGTTSNTRDLSLYIGSCAFSNCQKLSNINLKLARTIGAGAFSNCISLKNLDLYNCKIQNSAFAGCKNLSKVSLTNCTPIGSIKSMNGGIFYGCNNLTNLDLSGFTIRNYEFAKCEKLSKVILKNCGGSIGNSAFFNCYNLKEVYIYGSELLSLGGSDVFNCTQNTPIPTKVPISGLKIYVKAGQKENYMSLPNWSQYENKIIEMFENNQISYTTNNGETITINIIKGEELSDYNDVNLDNDIENEYFKTYDYGLITFKNKNVVSNLEEKIFSNNSNLISMKIPYTCEIIGKSAFQNCENLKEINFMENLSESETEYTGESGEYDQTKIIKQKLTTIEEYAFQNCKKLTSFEIPNSVTKIGSGAFEGCVNIEHFEGNKNLIRYDNKAIVYNRTLIYVSPKDDRDILSRFCDIYKIDSNITTLGKGCFNACVNLMRIDIPDGVKKIESGVFKGCENLCEIHFKGKTFPDIEDNVKELFFDTTDSKNKDRRIIIFCPQSAIKQYAKKLKEISEYITLYPKPNNSTDTLLYKTTNNTGYTTIKKADKNQNIPTSATTVIFSENISRLKDNTFKDCTKLEYVYLPNNITSIGNKCFYNCSSLERIRIPYNVSSFGDEIFYGCKALKEFYSYKDGCVSDDKMCYFNNNSLQFFAQGGLNKEKTYTIKNESITAINKYVFKDIDIESITIDNSGIDTIDSYAFDNCKKLTNINISSVKNISDYAFNNCSELSKINIINKKTESIGKYAFNNCKKLTNIDISSVKNISDYAFNNCSELSVIDIPNIESIGLYAFKDCKKMYLKSQMFNVTTISDGAFYGCSNFKYCPNLNNLEYSEPLSLGKINCINKDTFKGCEALKYVDLTNIITSIGESSFEGCKSLIALYNEVKNLKTINKRAFYDCANLTTINIKRLTDIGDEAFKNCIEYDIDSDGFPINVETIGKNCFENSGIKNLIIKKDSKLKNISEYAFAYCAKLKTVDLSNSSIEKFEKYSFSNNNLLYKIYLPSTLKWIRDGVFYKCKSLYNIIFPPKLEGIGNKCLDTGTSDTKIYIQESLKTPPQFTIGNYIRSCYPFGKPNATSTPIIYVKAELGDIYREKWSGKFYEIKTFTDSTEIPNLDDITDPNTNL